MNLESGNSPFSSHIDTVFATNSFPSPGFCTCYYLCLECSSSSSVPLCLFFTAGTSCSFRSAAHMTPPQRPGRPSLTIQAKKTPFLTTSMPHQPLSSPSSSHFLHENHVKLPCLLCVSPARIQTLGK